MTEEAATMDLMAKLPDEVLIQMFDHLPSLRNKLRLESVSHRFQRCLFQLLNTRPMRLELSARKGLLNGYRLQNHQFPGALLSLVKKAKFDAVDINLRIRDPRGNVPSKGELGWILSALVSSDNGCLDKVTTLQIASNVGCNETLLKDALDKCAKLSSCSDDAEGRHDYDGRWPLNLGNVLTDKALIVLDISLKNYTQQQIVQLYQSIKPNTLKKVYLRLEGMSYLDFHALVTELGGGAWASLEEMHLRCYRMQYMLDRLFYSLAGLPSLRKCYFVMKEDVPHDKLVAALTPLFANRIEILFVVHDRFHYHEFGCRFVALIRQMQTVHPGIEVDFGINGHTLTLTLGKASFQQDLPECRPCNNENCLECGIFYPSLTYRIADKANQEVDRHVRGMQPDEHLATGRLDRCRVDTIVNHLNLRTKRLVDDPLRKQWRKALLAEMNEAQDLATITFATQLHSIGDLQFPITVDCDRVLAMVALGALMLDDR